MSMFFIVFIYEPLAKTRKMSFRQFSSRNPAFKFFKRMDPRQNHSGMTIFLQEAHMAAVN